MNWKELFVTMLAVALGLLLANVISKKVPALSSWDDSYDDTFDSTYDPELD